MKRLLYIFAFLTLFITTALGKAWRAEELNRPAGGLWVSNPDNILAPSTVSQLNRYIENVKNETGAQMGVAVVNEIEGDIDNFATELFQSWGVGRKGANNGVLLVVDISGKEYAIRTGRGIGDVLPDITTARIARETLVPNFKNDNYDAGVLETIQAMGNIMLTPEAKASIKEGVSRARENEDQSLMDILLFYLWCCVGLTVVLLIIFLVKMRATKGLERHARYVELQPFIRILHGLCYVGLGIPLFLYIPARQYLNNLRNGEHKCPNCGTKMDKLDEVHDNEHLTPAQDAEEKYNSVDYDVWLCPNCGEEDVYAFENQDSELLPCPHCKAKTAKYLRDRVVKMPTTQAEGMGFKEFSCLNCKKISQTPFKIPRQVNAAGVAAAAAPFIFMGGRGGGSGFGGGFGGGGFGGGSTGGGGTSGRW